MVEDIGVRRADRTDGPISVLAANDPAYDSKDHSVALRWPCDPYARESGRM